MKTIADLKVLPQWVGYTAKKIPMNPHTGGAAASNNPDTWATAAQAWSAKKHYGWAGIGYVFTIEAGVIGVDLDDCFVGEGTARRLTDTARQVVQMLNSYTELSPSGNGLHILACGSIPHSVKQPGFEMYNELRYFTVTGNQYGKGAVELGIASGDIEDRHDELNALFVTFGGDYEPPVQTIRPTAPQSVSAAYRVTIAPPPSLQSAKLEQLGRTVRDAPKGTGHNTLLKVATVAGGYVASGALNPADVEAELTAAAMSRQEPDLKEIERTIRDGMNYGATKPLRFEDTRSVDRMSHAEKIAALASA